MTSDRVQLRRCLRDRRRALSVEEQRDAATAVTEAVGVWIETLSPASAAVYAASDAEPDVSRMVTRLRAKGWQICYPRIDTDESGLAAMRFYRADDAHLVPGRFGLVEPDSDAVRVHASDLAIVLVPLVGFDRDLNRLGRGKGFYDTTFSFLAHDRRPATPLLVGIAHECQRVERLVPTPRDVPLDAVVTPQRIYGTL